MCLNLSLEAVLRGRRDATGVFLDALFGNCDFICCELDFADPCGVVPAVSTHLKLVGVVLIRNIVNFSRTATACGIFFEICALDIGVVVVEGVEGRVTEVRPEVRHLIDIYELPAVATFR